MSDVTGNIAVDHLEDLTLMVQQYYNVSYRTLIRGNVLNGTGSEWGAAKTFCVQGTEPSLSTKSDLLHIVLLWCESRQAGTDTDMPVFWIYMVPLSLFLYLEDGSSSFWEVSAPLCQTTRRHTPQRIETLRYVRIAQLPQRRASTNLTWITLTSL